MKLERGLISSLRSFEDAPRRISAAGDGRTTKDGAEAR
jgi:hypothetical protein